MQGNRRNPFAPAIGLALGGGGARGLAHVGVLRALEEHRIPVDLICGTSMGAIIGALYAREPDARAVEARVLDLLKTDILKVSGNQLTEKLERIARNKVFGPPVEHLMRLYRAYQYTTREHLMQDEAIREMLALLFDDQRIEDLALPFASVAVDLLTGERIIFNRGPIRKAVLASASIPGVFHPVRWRDRQLVDGAVLSLVPISAAYTLGSDLVIGVDVSPILGLEPKIASAADVLVRCDDLMARAFNALRLSEADIVLHPLHTDSSWSDFKRAPGFISAGYTGTLERMDDIRRSCRFPGNLLHILKRKMRGHHGWVDGPVPTLLESSSES